MRLLGKLALYFFPILLEVAKNSRHIFHKWKKKEKKKTRHWSIKGWGLIRYYDFCFKSWERGWWAGQWFMKDWHLLQWKEQATGHQFQAA
jgi:hypothetical protein